MSGMSLGMLHCKSAIKQLVIYTSKSPRSTLSLIYVSEKFKSSVCFKRSERQLMITPPFQIPPTHCIHC